jgi:hypothetical protein
MRHACASMKSSTMPDLQRARPEQRHQRDDVLEAVGLAARARSLHAARLELEHRRGLAVSSAAR